MFRKDPIKEIEYELEEKGISLDKFNEEWKELIDRKYKNNFFKDDPENDIEIAREAKDNLLDSIKL